MTRTLFPARPLLLAPLLLAPLAGCRDFATYTKPTPLPSETSGGSSSRLASSNRKGQGTAGVEILAFGTAVKRGA